VSPARRRGPLLCWGFLFLGGPPLFLCAPLVAPPNNVAPPPIFSKGGLFRVFYAGYTPPELNDSLGGFLSFFSGGFGNPLFKGVFSQGVFAHGPLWHGAPPLGGQRSPLVAIFFFRLEKRRVPRLNSIPSYWKLV